MNSSLICTLLPLLCAQRFGRVGKRQGAKAAAAGEPEAEATSSGKKVR